MGTYFCGLTGSPSAPFKYPQFILLLHLEHPPQSLQPLLTYKSQNILTYFPSLEPVDDINDLPPSSWQRVSALGDNVSEWRVIREVGWREVLCLVVDPRMTGGDGRREDAQTRAVRWRMGVEEERRTTLGGEIRYMDMDCHGALVISLPV